MLVGLVAWLPGWLVGWPPKFKREITTHVPGGGQARLLNGWNATIELISGTKFGLHSKPALLQDNKRASDSQKGFALHSKESETQKLDVCVWTSHGYYLVPFDVVLTIENMVSYMIAIRFAGGTF